MTVENEHKEYVYRENDKLFVMEDFIVRDIDDYFREYDNSITIE